jgi:hypothetical protein
MSWHARDEATGTGHDDIDGNEIVTMITKDIVIKKQKPSGFFGTNLASYLTLLGSNSVIIAGTTTLGCVRATAVDAFSLNYRVIRTRYINTCEAGGPIGRPRALLSAWGRSSRRVTIGARISPAPR